MKKVPKKHKQTIEERIGDEVEKEVLEVKREWRHFLKFKDENYLLFTAFVVLIAAAVIINAVYIIKRNNDNDSTSTKAKILILAGSTKILASQQPGGNDSETVKISSVTENDKNDPAFTIDPSETMLILNISITNNTNDSQPMIPVNQFYVRTSEGDLIKMHASMYVTSPLIASTVAPHKTVTGQLSFNVAKHIAHPLLYIDTGWGNNVPLVYDVLR
jgi:Domain of unknown function (DUF4352)